MSPERESGSIQIAPHRVLDQGTLLEECLQCVFLRHGPGGVATTDAQGRLRYLNPMALEILGLSEQEVLGTHANQYLARGGFRLREFLRQLRREGSFHDLGARLRRSDGTDREVELTVVLLRDLHGRRSGFLVTCTDRSHEAYLTDELRLKENRLSGIVESTADAVLGLDTQGRITTWNRGAERMYGYAASEVVGRPAAGILLSGPHRQEEITQELGSGWKGQDSARSWEASHRHKDGHELRVLVTLSPLRDPSGSWTGSSAVIKDISDLKRLEEELLQSERLAAVGQLSASIAHEVKNPLAAIRGAVEVLGDRVAQIGTGPDPVVGEILGQIDRLDRLVVDLLSFARPSPPTMEPCRVSELLESTLQLLREEPLRQGVTLYRNFDPDLPQALLDPRQMEQAFLNLLLNALQAMDGEGTLTITTDQHGDSIRIQVKDTGPGLPPGGLRRLSQPFFTTKHRGTGLGLSIVKKVVEAHGGSVEARNHADGGALFTLFLPLAPSKTDEDVPVGTTPDRS